MGGSSSKPVYAVMAERLNNGTTIMSRVPKNQLSANAAAKLTAAEEAHKQAQNAAKAQKKANEQAAKEQKKLDKAEAKFNKKLAKLNKTAAKLNKKRAKTTNMTPATKQEEKIIEGTNIKSKLGPLSKTTNSLNKLKSKAPTSLANAKATLSGMAANMKTKLPSKNVLKNKKNVLKKGVSGVSTKATAATAAATAATQKLSKERVSSAIKGAQKQINSGVSPPKLPPKVQETFNKAMQKPVVPKTSSPAEPQKIVAGPPAVAVTSGGAKRKYVRKSSKKSKKQTKKIVRKQVRKPRKTVKKQVKKTIRKPKKTIKKHAKKTVRKPRKTAKKQAKRLTKKQVTLANSLRHYLKKLTT